MKRDEASNSGLVEVRRLLEKDVFHQVGRLLRPGQEVTHVGPQTRARKALRIMVHGGFSQLPVLLGSRVVGVFSYRAFALELALGADSAVDAGSRPVSDFLEPGDSTPRYAKPSDDFSNLVEDLDKRDAVLVSGRESLRHILTPMDVLRYLDKVAGTFVLVQEIELALRTLIRGAAPEAESLRECISNALSHRTDSSCGLEHLSFSDYVSVMTSRKNWQRFGPVLGETRKEIARRLGRARVLRNGVMHFKDGDLGLDARGELRTYRNWLLERIRQLSESDASGDPRASPQPRA